MIVFAIIAGISPVGGNPTANEFAGSVVLAERRCSPFASTSFSTRATPGLADLCSAELELGSDAMKTFRNSKTGTFSLRRSLEISVRRSSVLFDRHRESTFSTAGRPDMMKRRCKTVRQFFKRIELWSLAAKSKHLPRFV